MSKAIPSLLLLILAGIASAQTAIYTENRPVQIATYTESTAAPCTPASFNCANLPLNVGGTWHFSLDNNEFVLSPSPCGYCLLGYYPTNGDGIQQVTRNTLPPYPNTGSGEVDFTWTAKDSNERQYMGSAVVDVSQNKQCNQHGCWADRSVTYATITVRLEF